MNIGKKKTRQRRMGPRRNGRRFAYLESLESRILLDGSLFDGSGALGNNVADDLAVITNSFYDHAVNFSYDLGPDALARQSLGDQGTDDGNAVAVDSANAALTSLDLYIDFGSRFSPLLGEGFSPLTGEGLSAPAGNEFSPLARPASSPVTGEPISLPTGYFDEPDSSSPILPDNYQSSTARPGGVLISSDGDDSVDESTIAVIMDADLLHGTVKFLGESGRVRLFAYWSDPSPASLPGTIDDPVVIPMPSQSIEFLPAESLPIHGKQNGPASSVAEDDQPGIESKRTAIAVASASREPNQKISPYKATDAGSVTAISSDRYFANYARRTSAGMSTHSAASESRQHVIATVHHVAPHRGTADGTPLVTFQLRAVSPAFATGGTAATWWTTRAKQVVTASRPDGVDQTSDVHLTRLTLGIAGVTEPDRLDRNPCSNDVSRRLRDLALSLYEPVSFVVGVSLVSAHAITETNAAKKHPSQALRKR